MTADVFDIAGAAAFGVCIISAIIILSCKETRHNGKITF